MLERCRAQLHGFNGEHPARDAVTLHSAFDQRKKKTAPGRRGSRSLRCGYDNCYWVGRISCENPMVLTERNDGVRGGRHAGPRVKLVSKV
jgi:hypothetical protein